MEMSDHHLMKNNVVSRFFTLPTVEARSHWVLNQIYQKFAPKHCFIAKFIDEDMVRSSLHYQHGKVAENITYDLKDTPCAEAKNILGVCCYLTNVQGYFPKDIDFKNLAIESYMGVAIRSPNNDVIGLLVCLFDHQLDEDKLDKQWFSDVSYLLGVEINNELTHTYQTSLVSKLELGEALASTCIIEWNTVTCALVHNDQVFKVLGIEKHTVVTRKFLLSIIAREDRTFAIKEIKQAFLADKSTFEFNIKIIQSNDDIKYLAVLGKFVADNNTGALVIHLVLQDISESYNVNRALYLSNMMFEHTTEGVIITDSHNKIIQVNNAFIKCSGYQREEILGQSPSLLNSGMQDNAFYQEMWATLHDEDFWLGELHNRCKNGEIIPVALSISVVKNEQQEITNYVAVFKDISLWKETEEQLSFYANKEQLTGLYNRHAFIYQLEQDIERQPQQIFTLLYVDIVRFKALNDVYGQAIGDQVLIAVAKKIEQEIGENNYACRYASDEFIIKISGLNASESHGITRALLTSFETPVEIENTVLEVKVSIGLAEYLTNKGTALETIRNAQYAMTSVTNDDHHQFGIYDVKLHQKYLRSLGLREKLKLAIEEQRLQVFYQPIICAKTNEILKFEALARWTDDEYGFIAPDEFIPVAESSGLIVPLGQLVLDQACRDLALIHHQGFEQVSISINRSINEFRLDNNQVMAITLSAEKHGIPPKNIIIEVTESVAMSSNAYTKKALEDLIKAGFNVFLDDFCTGHSSLSNLMDYSADALKIDRSFINQLLTNYKNKVVTKSLIDLAHQLGMLVVAEGVEEQKQRDVLKQLGCDLIQGYFYSPAVPIEQCLDMLNNYKIKDEFGMRAS